MAKRSFGRAAAIGLSLLVLLLPGCGRLAPAPSTDAPASDAPAWDPTPEVLVPETPGETVYENDLAVIDASHAAQGYVCVKTQQEETRVKVQLTLSGKATYTYNLPTDGSYAVLPLSSGDGHYTLNVYHNVYGDQYALDLGAEFDATLENEFLPFLYPNQYVKFSKDSQAVAKGAELAAGAQDELDVVGRVYDAVVQGVAYDDAKLEGLPSSYLPDVDETLSSGKGICFDYAALMTAMLRSQRIPTRLIVGYSGDVYHAWISVYVAEVGWINNIIHFDGTSWVRMDPTFAASSNSSDDIMQYIGDGSHYNEMYSY